jgi:hypothetical protein
MKAEHLTPGNISGAILFTKASRSLLAWLSAYLAAKLFQDKYTQEVYVDRVAPSGLTGYVVYFAMFQAAFAALTVSVMAGITYILAGNRSELGVLLWYAGLDAVLELALGTLILYSIANTMQTKKYFNYRYEGLRAIRALRNISFNVNMATANIPYFMLIGDVAASLKRAV